MQSLATGLALALTLLLAWAVRRFQPGLGARRADMPQVPNSTALGPRERLMLVRYRNKGHLLGVGVGSVQFSDRWPAAASPPGAQPSPQSAARDAPA